MPNDEETKKRWRVRKWKSDVHVKDEAADLERALNQLDADNYEIYDVCFDKCLIVGCLEDPHELIADGMPESVGPFASALLNRLATLRQTATPESPPPPVEPESEDEGIKALREYTIQGQRTLYLLSGIQSVTSFAQMGDPQSDQRLTAIIQSIFGSAPIEETRKSLADLEFYKDHHTKYSCNDATCESHQIFERAVEKLKARLAASPAN